MKNPFKRAIIESAAFAITIMVLACPKVSLAAETDPYTYSCIKLEDSAVKINFKLNQILEEVFLDVNKDINKFRRHSSDTYAEFYFSYHYFKKMFVDEYGNDAFSVFETCIDANTCEGWPYFERIYLKANESIYFDANYSELTKKYMASTVQVCGVRIGTDKLTHLLKDGFQLYNAKKHYGSTDEELLKYSIISENTFFGKNSTGVYSNADIVANTAGVKFFEDIFSKHVVRQKNGQLKFTKVDICSYINNRFSERISKNSYSQGKAKRELLEKAMNNRIQQCSDKNRSEILARKAQPSSVGIGDKMYSAMSNVIEYIRSADFRRAQEIFMELEPIFQGREDTHIPKENN